MKNSTIAGIAISFLLITLMLIPAARGEATSPILLEQRIVQVSLNAENQDGIEPRGKVASGGQIQPANPLLIVGARIDHDEGAFGR